MRQRESPTSGQKPVTGGRGASWCGPQGYQAKWDDEEDGGGSLLLCRTRGRADVSGCGAPMVANPAYKGKWTRH